MALQVYFFPSGASSLTDQPWWFALLAAAGLVTSFTSTLMFTALGSFYTRISDPDMGGSYLTLLNTIANMGEWAQCFGCHPYPLSERQLLKRQSQFENVMCNARLPIVGRN